MSDVRKYSADQPRDNAGRFASASGGYIRADVSSSMRKPDGGFTLKPDTNELVTSGYSVSPYPERSRKLPKVARMTDAEVNTEIKSYMVANRDLLSKPEHMLGGWHDPQTGDAWLDVSIVVDSPAEAVKVGLEHDQIAYFDFQTFESVDIDRNARSGQ